VIHGEDGLGRRVIADEELLPAAQDLLFEVGSATFTLEKSASRAGVSPTTLTRGSGRSASSC